MSTKRTHVLIITFMVAVAVSSTACRSAPTASSPSATNTVESIDPSNADRTGSGGPQEPPCGNVELIEDGTIAGRSFPRGTYVIHSFGIDCDLVLGDDGLFSSFLRLDDAPLPDPWSYLDGAVGAPKFVAGPGEGFRVQRIS